MVEGQGSKTTNVVLGNDERGNDDNGGQSSAGPLKRVPSKHYLSGTCVSVSFTTQKYAVPGASNLCLFLFFNTNYTYTSPSSRMNNFIRYIQ